MRSYATIMIVAAMLWSQLAPSRLAAQSRHRISIRAPGEGISHVGQRGSSYTFRTYSYGLGSLQRGPSEGGRGRLRSAVRNQPTPTIVRNGGASPGAFSAAAAPTAARASKRYTPLGNVIATPPRRPRRAPYASALGMTTTYLQAINSSPGEGLEKGAEPITSLVPTGAGSYRDHMDSADKAFRAGDYSTAATQYELANLLAGRSDPESLLGMMHTRLALSRVAYNQASEYLRQALKYLPELPLLPLDPKGFYGETKSYQAQLARLEDHVKRRPRDANVLLLLTYFYWFGGDVNAARQALARCAACARSERTVEAVDTFRDGMLASGKVCGKLTASTQPGGSGDSGRTAPGRSQ